MGAQLLISAGALDGRVVTCSPGIRDDVRATGAAYRDEGVVISGNLISCRGNDDLPAFCQRLFGWRVASCELRVAVDGRSQRSENRTPSSDF